MRKLVVFCFLLFFAHQHVDAQTASVIKPNYKTAAGLRFYPFGLTVKTNLDTRRAALEFIGYFRNGFSLIGLYEWHFPINQPRNLRFYFGGGGLVGFKNERSGGGGVLGVSGVIGLDYKFLHYPINLTLDWQPSFQIGRVDEMLNYGGIGVRFAF